MKYASDFRSIARDALRGRWGIAVIAGLIASLLGAVASNGPEVNFNFGDNGASMNLMFADQQIYSTSEGWISELNAFIVGGAIYAMIAALIMVVLFFVLGGVISLGYSRLNLDFVDRQKAPELGTLFGFFPYWKNAAIAKLLKTLYEFLWSLLFIIPGIIASYSYAMMPYILAEHPEMAPSEAIARSKEMMDGNRWRLFCLHFSFIGWGFLSALTLGVGNLWLRPYKEAATAAFYRAVSGMEYVQPAYYIASESDPQV